MMTDAQFAARFRVLLAMTQWLQEAEETASALVVAKAGLALDGGARALAKANETLNPRDGMAFAVLDSLKRHASPYEVEECVALMMVSAFPSEFCRANQHVNAVCRLLALAGFTPRLGALILGSRSIRRLRTWPAPEDVATAVRAGEQQLAHLERTFHRLPLLRDAVSRQLRDGA